MQAPLAVERFSNSNVLSGSHTWPTVLFLKHLMDTVSVCGPRVSERWGGADPRQILELVSAHIL